MPLLPKGTRIIAELGSGAGIPGLVVAMAADLEAHLYESNGKKAAFLREAARQTGTRAHVHMVRLETLKTEPTLPKVDCVVARALAPLAAAARLCRALPRPAGPSGFFTRDKMLMLN